MTEINGKRLSYLYEAVTMGTIRAAADKLNIAPSAISRQISLLEEELACTLIERHRKGVTPTEAGSVLYDFIENHFLLKRLVCPNYRRYWDYSGGI